MKISGFRGLTKFPFSRLGGPADFFCDVNGSEGGKYQRHIWRESSSILPLQRFSSQSAVTLIEIMVTIVVISVLAVMIIVGGKQFKRSAAGASCCSNLRQIYTAAQAYIKDHDGYFPSIRWDNPSTLAVPGFADYLDLDEDPKNERAFRRTVMTCDAVQLGPKPSRRPFYMTYSINSAATRNYSPALSLDKPSRIPHPSKMLFFTEGAVNPTLLGFGLMSEPYNYYTHVNYLHLDQLTFPHNGYQNVLFLDGHMELLKYENFDKEKLDPLWAGN